MIAFDAVARSSGGSSSRAKKLYVLEANGALDRAPDLSGLSIAATAAAVAAFLSTETLAVGHVADDLASTPIVQPLVSDGEGRYTGDSAIHTFPAAFFPEPADYDLYSPDDTINPIVRWPASTALTPLRAGAIAAMEFYGHSLTYIGSSTYVNGTDQRLSAALNAEDRNRTHGGSILSYNEINPYEGTGNGGWAELYRWTEQELTAHAAPYEALRDLAMLWSGLNDLGYLGPSLTELIPFRNSLRATISRLRAAALFENTHASVTYPDVGAGNFTEVVVGVSRIKAQSGTSYHRTSATVTGKRVRVAVPSDFKGSMGGEVVALSFICATDGSGALWDITVDGAAAGQVDTRNVNAKDHTTGLNGRASPVVKRFTSLTPGAHTIEANIVSLSGAGAGYGIFDCWWIEGRTKPLIVVPLANRPYSWGLYAATPYTPTDADLPTLNTVITDVVAEFDADVMTVDLDTTLAKDPKYFVSDGAHFNDEGHAVVTEILAEVIYKHQRTLSQHAAGSATPGHVTRNPHLLARNIITPASPRQAALTLMGHPAGDQSASLLAMLSGLNTTTGFFGIGREIIEAYVAVAGNVNSFVTGATVGDLQFIVTDATKGFEWGLSNVLQMRLTSAALAFSNGQQITGLGAGTANGHALRYEQVVGVYALLASPALTGNPTAPTQSGGDNSTKLATTAYVDSTHGELGYAQITANQTGITADADVTGLTITVTGQNRPVSIEAFCGGMFSTAAAQKDWAIFDGATELNRARNYQATASGDSEMYVKARVAAFTGSKTFKVVAKASAGSATVRASATGAAPGPAWIRAVSE